MRIALLTPQWSATVGGPSNYVASLRSALQQLGHTARVITTDAGEGAIHIDGRSPFRDLRLLQQLRELRPEIVHVHGRAHFIPSALLYRGVAPRARIVFTFHTQPYTKSFVPDVIPGRPDYNAASRLMVAWLLRRCDAVTTVSRSIIDNLNERYSLGIERFEVIPSAANEQGVDPIVLRDFKETQGLNNQGPIIASIGVFSWDWKVAGHMVCIEAMAQLKKKYPRILLLIAGDGQYAQLLRDHARRTGVEDIVRFLGNVRPPSTVLAAADIYVQMAMNEGCSLSLIEAMLAAKPIVASDLGGNPEIIGDRYSGRLVGPHPSSVADAVTELVEDLAGSQRLGYQAQAVARSSFTWPLVARRYAKLYEQLLSS